MLLAPRLNCNSLTSDLALPLALLSLLILASAQLQQLVKSFTLSCLLNVAPNSLPLLTQVGHKCQMSLQFYDHDFPPLQWHIFIKSFWAFGKFQSSFTVTVSANTLVLTFTNTCDQIWKFLTLTCLSKVFNFKTILLGPERKSCSKTKSSKLNFSPYKAILIVLALKVIGRFLLYMVALNQKLSKSNHIIETCS